MRENRLAKRVGRTRGRLAPELLLLSVAYGLGLTAGHFIGRAAGADAEIRTYLAAYAQALESGSTVTAASLLGVAMAYYRMPCAVFFCSFLRNANYFFCGIFLLEGFLLSYAVACFSGGAAGSFDFPVYAGDSGNVRPPGIAVFGFAQAKVCAGNCRTARNQAAVSAAGSGRPILIFDSGAAGFGWAV